MLTWIVTGGAGFIGSNFVRRARAAGRARLVVFDKLTYAGHLESLEGVLDGVEVRFVQGDIADREAVRAVFAEARPDVVVNFAALQVMLIASNCAAVGTTHTGLQVMFRL